MGRPKKDTPNRADGLYEVKVTIGKDFTGKLIRKSFYSSISKADARAKAEEYKITKAVSEATGTVNVTSARTFESWANKWLETYKKGVVKDHTYNFTYKSNLEKYLIPYFGKAHISDIQQIDIQKYFNTIRNENGKPLARSTLEKHKLILKSMFDAAIDNDLCYRNPVKNIKFQHVSDTTVKNVWTKEQAEIAEKYARRQWRLDVVLYLHTGLRRSELLGLKWTDIDFKENTLHVQRAVVQTKGKIVVDRPKSATSDRIVPFSADFGEYLKKFQSDNEYVIGTDGIMSPSTYAKYFSKFMQKLNEATGVPILTPHELRHTYGTLKRAEGVDIYTIQKVMGHADISITAEIYVHNDIDVLKKQLKV
ncbi:MAG: site-specific integrase [Ruminococcus sp.]|nr:site-specific integrase [Ruminococcus sp.]